jgi:hypothetical protein
VFDRFGSPPLDLYGFTDGTTERESPRGGYNIRSITDPAKVDIMGIAKRAMEAALP